MTLMGVASAMGVTTSALHRLVSGEVTPGVASHLGTTTRSLQGFIEGGRCIGLASHIGCTTNTLAELRATIGREGAIGFLIGLCVQANKP
jgi:hypothetical protein